MAPAKCAPSNSCVPPPMGAVGVTLKDQGGGGSGGGGGGCGGCGGGGDGDVGGCGGVRVY